jgi:hypothetical protein
MALSLLGRRKLGQTSLDPAASGLTADGAREESFAC